MPLLTHKMLRLNVRHAASAPGPVMARCARNTLEVLDRPHQDEAVPVRQPADPLQGNAGLTRRHPACEKPQLSDNLGALFLPIMSGVSRAMLCLHGRPTHVLLAAQMVLRGYFGIHAAARLGLAVRRDVRTSCWQTIWYFGHDVDIDLRKHWIEAPHKSPPCLHAVFSRSVAEEATCSVHLPAIVSKLL